jgi:ABC-type sugar transport system permease subunit
MFPDPDSKLAQRLNLNLILFLLPALSIYVVFAIYPTYSVFEYSLTDWNGISPERNFVGLENYQRLFTDKIFWEAFRNTFVWSAIIIVINVGFGLVIAAMLARVWIIEHASWGDPCGSCIGGVDLCFHVLIVFRGRAYGAA